MALNTKITRIQSNSSRELVGFYSGTRLIRFVSMVKELALTTDNSKIIVQSSGLPSFEFDVFSITDIDGTLYSELSPTSGQGGEQYLERISEILEQLYGIFKGCCSDGGGGSDIQFQQDGVDFGTVGEYTTYNFVGATLTETAPGVVEITADGVSDLCVARIRRTANQSIPSGAGWTDVVWQAAAYEEGGNYWTSGAECTVPESGYYQIFSELSYDGTGLLSVMTSYSQLLLNGVPIGSAETPIEINSIGSLDIMAQRYLSAGDVIKVQTRHSEGMAHNVIVQGDHSPDIIFTKVGGVQADMGQAVIQVQNLSVNVGTAGQYTTYNFTGGVTVTQTSPNTIEINVAGGSGGQVSIQYKDEGVDLGSAGTVDSYNVVGQLHKATRTLDAITHTAPSVGENLVLPSLDAANALSAQIGAFNPNVITWSTTGKQNNLSLTGWNDAWNASAGTGKATTIEYTGTSYAICSGIVGGATGRVLIIQNKSNKLLILENESTDSTSTNRFKTKDGLAVFVMPQESEMFLYSDGRWNLIGIQTWNTFDDFSGFSGATTQASNTFYFNGISTTSSGLSSQQVGLISMQPTAAARSHLFANWNGGYQVGGTSTPVLYVSRVALSASVSTFGRVAIGFGQMGAAAGAFYTATTGTCNGAVWGFASDSGLPNATTNWFLYSGIGGAVDILGFGVDSGIPIANCVNNYNNFAVYFDVVNSVFEFFYSQSNGVWQYVNNRTRLPSGSVAGQWYEATNASRPTMWIDYAGAKTKIVSNR